MLGLWKNNGAGQSVGQARSAGLDAEKLLENLLTLLAMRGSWQAGGDCEHISPVEGHRALSRVASNIPTPTITAVTCAPGYSPKMREMQRTDFQKE